jgi:photosystem II stability/assembly factor-like uncharacterized protein
MKKFILLFLFLYNISYSQSAWNWYLSYPTTNNYNCVKFIDHNTGFITGENGTLLRTTNGGTNWNFIETNTNRLYTCVFPVNSSVAYALNITTEVGYECNLYKSTNGGLNWFIQKTFPSVYLRSLYFLNSNTGYASGDNGKIHYTTDGGLNWVDRSFSTSSSIQTIQFINEQTGYASGNFPGILIKTTNGGLNWISSFFNNNSYYSSFSFKDANTGIVCGGTQAYTPYPPYYSGQEKIFRTSNGGQTWDSLIFSTGGIFRTMCAYNNNVLVFGEASSRRSTDFGLSWSYAVFTLNPVLRYSCLIDTSVGYAVGDSGKILKILYLGNGTNQNFSFTTLPVTSIYFINTNTGYMVMKNIPFFSFSHSYIYKTINAGENWFQCYDGYGRKVSNVMFSGNYGVANDNRELYLSRNGGNNWSYYWYPTTFDIHNSIILPNGNAIAVGDSNLIIKSTDFGTWSQYQLSGVGHLLDIIFTDESTGYIISSNNKYLKSTNTGNNWIVQTIPENYIQCFYFLNSNTGYIFAGISLLKTTNGGLNWISKMSNNTLFIKKIYFLDTIKGFAIGNYASQLNYTTNGGVNWTPTLLHNNSMIYSINFANPSTGYITGGYGTIFKTTNGGTIWVNNIESKIPKNFSLSQNYPNPFNPNTIIRFQIKDSRFVTLKIFNILGKEIATLVNEKQSPGTYEVSWDGSAYPSGVYFYKLITGDFTETKKMVMIK